MTDADRTFIAWVETIIIVVITADTIIVGLAANALRATCGP